MGTSRPYVLVGNSLVDEYFNRMGLNGKLCGAFGTKSFGPKNCISDFLELFNCGLLLFSNDDLGVVQGLELDDVVVPCFFHSFCLIFCTVFRCSFRS